MIRFIVVSLLLVVFTGCKSWECQFHSTLEMQPMHCGKYETHQEMRCTSNAMGRAIVGGLTGHLLLGNGWGSTGAVLGAATATQNCKQVDVRDCVEWIKAVYVPNPNCRNPS